MLLMIKPFRIYKILILFILILSLSSCKNSKTENDINGEDIVFICTGRLSKAYHTYEDCYGLNRCSGELRKITKSEAKTLRRHFCTFCRNR